MNQTTTLSPAQIDEASAALEYATPRQILSWAMDTFGSSLTMATAFGPEGCCLLHMIAALRDEGHPVPDVFNLETGYQFGQTLALRLTLQERYGLTIRLVSAAESVKEMEARLGGPIYGSDPDLCCNLRKVVPLEHALKGFQAWISAIRRDQTPERAQAPVVGLDQRFGLVKISPLANWTKAQVQRYIQRHEIPTNPLHAQGFTSIGCWPCTHPVADGEDERAGRWVGRAKRECGIHLGAGVGGKEVKIVE